MLKITLPLLFKKQQRPMDSRKWKKYLKRNSSYVILIMLSTVLVQCDPFNNRIRPEKPPYLKIGDTLVYHSEENVNSFYIEEATLYEPGEFKGNSEEDTNWSEELYISSMVQIDCGDSCYKIGSSIDPIEYWIGLYGYKHSSQRLWAGIAGNSYVIGVFDLNDLYKIRTKLDTISGKEISSLLYSKKYSVVEYELTNGEIFDLDEACITMMEERHKAEK
jgi:hypothetical protein